MPEPARPLGNLRVVELAGPEPMQFGKAFADLGADVIKVEPPGGDPSRFLPPFRSEGDDGERSLYWAAYAAGKRSVVADLDARHGQERVRELIATADVLVEAFAPGHLESIGLNFETLRDINPRLVFTSLSPFGPTGPLAAWKGSDLVQFAMSGYLNMTGPPDGRPLKPSAPYQTWFHGSMQAVAATLIALHARRRTGRGTRIDQSLRDTGIWMLTHTYQFWDLQQVNLKRQGAARDMGGVLRLPSVWRTVDGYVVWLFQAGHLGAHRMRQLVELMGEHGMAPDWLQTMVWEEFDLLHAGPDAAQRLRDAFGSFFASRPKHELLEWALPRGVMLAPVQTLPDVLADEQLAARAAWHSLGPEAGTQIPGPPVRLGDGGWTPRGRAPTLGEHDETVFGEARRLEAALTEAREYAPSTPNTASRRLAPPPNSGELATEHLGTAGRGARSSAPVQNDAALRATNSPAVSGAPGTRAPKVGGAEPNGRAAALEGQGAEIPADHAAPSTGSAESGSGALRPPTAHLPTALPLQGVRVIDMCTTVAGPSAVRHLADFGAQVIKVESSAHPDTLRAATPYAGKKAGVNRSAYFAAYNAGKQSLTLNLQKPEARDVLRRLVECSDVLVETFVPGVMRRWGLTYETLSAWNPRLIMASHCLQGQTGPHAAHRGYGQIASAMSGWYDLTGDEDGEPLGPYSAYTDFICWPFLASAILVALEVRDETGLGQRIDHAQLESSIHFLAAPLLDLQVNGQAATRRGNHEDYACPNNVYPCKGDDRWLALTVMSDEEWRAACSAIGYAGAAQDPRFMTVAARRENEAELDDMVAGWTAGREASELAERLQAAGVAAGQVAKASDLFADPQLAHRGFFRRLDHAELGEHAVLTQSFRIEGVDAGPWRSAPLLGEHTYALCSDLLGLSDAEIAGLTESGALS